MNIEPSKHLGKRVKEMTYTKFNTRRDEGVYYSVRDEGVYYSVKTGVLDYFGDEIILSVFPHESLITDEGYTVHSIESGRKPVYVSKARLLIESHGAILTDTYYPNIQMTYDEDWIDVAKKLTSCIVDVYAVLL